MEENNDEYIDSIGACRKSENTIQALPGYTHGVIAWNNCVGYNLLIRPIIHRETTTLIIITFGYLFEYGSIYEHYYNRIHAVGWDVMCGIFLRLVNLMYLKLLDLQMVYAWSLLVLSLFIDKWHIRTHVRLICSLNIETGLFHPELPKFKGILNQCEKRNEAVTF